MTDKAGADARARNALAFLSYQDKFLAGSWRFDTYFGRDTLISALLLAPVLEPEAIESGPRVRCSIASRRTARWRTRKTSVSSPYCAINAKDAGRSATPIYDYGMVDDDFLLAPLAARWLLDDARGRARAREFLTNRWRRRTSGAAISCGWSSARHRSRKRRASANLVGIKPGRTTGQWRDSDKGLGARSLCLRRERRTGSRGARRDRATRGTRDCWTNISMTDQRRTLARARCAVACLVARAPRRCSPSTFLRTCARTAIAAYAQEIGVEAERGLHALGNRALAFPRTVARRRRPADPDPAIRTRASACCSPIRTPDGAREITSRRSCGRSRRVSSPTPGCSSRTRPSPRAELRREFTRFAYHGTVVWSWQQALMAAGLERQLAPRPICPCVRARSCSSARTRLCGLGRSRERAMRTSELWSWSLSPTVDTASSPSGGPAPTPTNRTPRSSGARCISVSAASPLYQRYFAWKLISLPSSGLASNTPPVSGGRAEDARVAFGEPELVRHVGAAQRRTASCRPRPP